MRWFPCCLACLALLVVSPLWAKPAHKQALANHFGPLLPRSLHDCRTCHVPEEPGAAEVDKEHNAFGRRLVEVKRELAMAGKPVEIADRIAAIANEDSDGDGDSNLFELLAGRNPGEAKDHSTAEKRKEHPSKLAAYQKLLASYPWRPFESVRKPSVPTVPSAAWVRNPIDAFIAAEHAERGLKPRPEAERAVLLRRVYLDLIGLPPTPAEQHAFLADRSPRAFEAVVEKLLASPQYGERWGRHWMDVWRYSDWAGWNQQVRDSQPHIWHWRDWIIESLNGDLPYDRMIREMLAGDEIAPNDPNTLRATGYLVRNYKLLSREKWMQDTVDHTFQAFLGVTLGCARCHDHMYDPIGQREYYQVRAVFEPHKVRTDRLPGVSDTKVDGLPRTYDADLTAATYFYTRGDERSPDKSMAITPGVPKGLGGRFPEVKPVPLPSAARVPDRRPFVIADTRKASEAEVAKAEGNALLRQAVVPVAGLGLHSVFTNSIAFLRAADLAELASLDARIARERHEALSAELAAEDAEEAGGIKSITWAKAAEKTAVAQRILAVTEARRALFAAERGLNPPPLKKQKLPTNEELQKTLANALEAAKKPATTVFTKRPLTTFPAESSGRRLALANWITDASNPLAARVAVNHLWLRHFGRGLVPSSADFGRNGQRPTHPALLDWLAAEIVAQGWSMKHMHKLIVTSATYRQASTPESSNLTKDADNVYLWRFPSRRLEAELVRDQIFYVAEALDLTRGGPEIEHAQGLTTPRRSVYFRHAAEKQMEFLKLFDCAAVTECYQRKDSIIPQQALALANSDLTIRHARLIAKQLHTTALSDTAFVSAAFERVLARPANADESAECLAFLRTGKSPEAASRLRENLVHVLMNHHDFVTVR